MREINETILEMKELARLNQVDVLYEKAKWLVELLETYTPAFEPSIRFRKLIYAEDEI